MVLKLICFLVLMTCSPGSIRQQNSNTAPFTKAAQQFLWQQVLREADWALQQLPITVTATRAARSAGGPHDFYSEGDYWWPNPLSADSPYLQKDGMSNPANFTAHREAMIRFSRVTGALAAAYKVTADDRYVLHALGHYKAWFTDTATMMYPQLQYAQAVKGRFTGRGIGIIDGIQLMEAAQGMLLMERSKYMDAAVLAGTKKWFTQFLAWLCNHPYGKDEMNAPNNHGTCWVMQTAVFAKLTGDRLHMEFCSNRYKNVLLPRQMADDGSFPLELKRTKAFGYSIFNLDAMATICQVLSSVDNDLWKYETPDGKSMKKGITHLYPFIADKTTWPLPPDVMYWQQWPVAQPFLLFGANAFNKRSWFNTWKALDHQSEEAEVIRNLPVRHPLIWME